MKTEDMPLFARLLAQHGINPEMVPMKANLEVVQEPDRQGIILDTVAADPDGDRFGLMDADGEPVIYRKFYPEPKEPR